jgi:Na+-transporting NADH:ubiquinone oxidoreductase subunit NqrB
MTTLLTVEGLLLASLSIALVLFVVPGFSKHTAWGLILALTVLMCFVALGAGAAWCEQFLGAWPGSLGEQIATVCIAIGVLAQPVIAIVVCVFTHPSKVEAS